MTAEPNSNMEALINRDPDLVEKIGVILDKTNYSGKRPPFNNAMEEQGQWNQGGTELT